MTDGSLLCAVPGFLEEPAGPGVDGLRENAEEVAVADMGEEVGVLLIRGTPRFRLDKGGPEEMDRSCEETVDAGDDLLFQREGVE